MNKYFVDTNIFFRLLLEDNLSQYRIVENLFKNAEQGKLDLWTTDVVILEIIWTLKSFFKYSNSGIRQTINKILAIENLQIENRELSIQALTDFEEKNVDFADAYNYQLAQKAGCKILSFDDDFKKLGRVEDLKKVVK